MTCIVGLAESGRVYIGGDSAGVAGYAIDVRADAKVFRNGAYLMGFTSSFRMGQLLRYSFKPPTPKGNLERFMVRDFMPAVMDALDDGGWLSTENGRRDGGIFLVGVQGQLFCVEADFQVGRTVNGYQAVGCGDAYALGSLHSTTKLKPLPRVRAALNAAAHHSAGVTGPFVIKSNSIPRARFERARTAAPHERSTRHPRTRAAVSLTGRRNLMAKRRWYVERGTDLFDDVGADSMEIHASGALVFSIGDEMLAYARGTWITVHDEVDG